MIAAVGNKQKIFKEQHNQVINRFVRKRDEQNGNAENNDVTWNEIAVEEAKSHQAENRINEESKNEKDSGEENALKQPFTFFKINV